MVRQRDGGVLVSVVDGFLTTSANARQTFGEGVPQTGEQYDKSVTLNQLQSTVQTAAPGSKWSGGAANAYDAANTDHGQVLGKLAKLDQRLAAHVNQSAAVVAAGRQNLDAIRRWVVDAAASVPQGQAGDQMRLSVVQKGLTDLQRVVQQSDGDMNKIAGQMACLRREFSSLSNQKFGSPKERGGTHTVRGVDFKTGDPPPMMPGQPIDPTNPFIGDMRFGHWEDVVAPPFTGPTPPPLKPKYRPFPEGTPLKVGGTTGWYTPGKSWVGDIDPPYAQLQEEYRFRIAGLEATTYTRMTYENGAWHQQRWVQNMYEYQKNAQMVLGGDVSVKGKSGDIGGLPTIPKIDYDWKPIALNEIATLSSNNMGVTYYLPDGCGGQITYQDGVPIGGMSGLPPSPPIMTRPR